MALRAGRVGVNPRIVDHNGNIKGMSCNTYTKEEIDQRLSGKANTSDVYTQSQVDTLLNGKADKSDTYTKDATNNILLDLLPDLFDTPPNVEASGNPLVLTDSAGGNAAKCVVTLEPIQSGSGTPSPQNVRPISGLTELTLTVNGTSITRTYGQTVYGGSDDVTGEGVTIVKDAVDLGSLEWEGLTTAQTGKSRFRAVIPNSKQADTSKLTSICSNYVLLVNGGTWSAKNTGYTISAYSEVVLYDDNLATLSAADFKAAMNGVTMVYELITPTSIPLTAQNIALLHGDNVLTTDGTNIALSYPVDVASYIRRKLGMSTESTRALSKSLASEEIQEEVKDVSDLTPLEEVVEIKTVEPVETVTTTKTNKRTSTKK